MLNILAILLMIGIAQEKLYDHQQTLSALISPEPVLAEAPASLQFNSGRASYYDQSVCGTRIPCRTASGETFKEDGLTVAQRSLPFGTRLEFVYGQRSVVCQVNDRGPFVAKRDFDLALGCARALGTIQKGVVILKWRIIQ